MIPTRYQRQVILKGFGINGQQKLAKARILVVGAGGLGIPALQYLNAMGVGTIGVVEQDIIDISNLQRQVIYGESDVGRSKLSVCLDKLEAQNSNTVFIGHDTFLVKDNALKIIADYDLVIDATDNFPTRYLINDSCIILKKPFIYGALHGYEAQISVFNYKGGPTYRCLFPQMPADHEIPNCNENGVLGVLPGIVGNLQALEAIKVISGVGEVLSGKLLIFDGLNSNFVKIDLPLVPENLKISNLQDIYNMQACDIGPQITVDELQELMQSNKNLQIIDVRTYEEYRLDHLKNSINLPLSELGNRLRELNTDTDIYLLCQSGIRSLNAQALLREALPNCVTYNVKGGLDRYSMIYS